MLKGEIVGVPWGGFATQVSPLDAPSNTFEEVYNFLLKKGRIESKPKFNTFPTPPNGEAILGARTFLDVLSNFHTLVLTSSQAYFLTAGGTYTPVGDPFSSPSTYPYAIEVMLNKAYFANGGKKVTYVDGSADLLEAGDVPATAFFMGKLGYHLVLAYTIEGGVSYPHRVRWSKTGDPTNWSHFTAGSNDILDVEDQISGFVTLSPYGYIFRFNGITVMAPTGQGLKPFTWENFSIGPSGIGLAFPYTLAVYGKFCVGVSSDDVYYFDGGMPEPIGRGAKKEIFRDLYARVGNPQAWITGTLGKGIDFLAYWLCIPIASDTTRVYIFNFNESSWTSFKIPSLGRVSFLGNVATG